jgi:hypothetical protein
MLQCRQVSVALSFFTPAFKIFAALMLDDMGIADIKAPDSLGSVLIGKLKGLMTIYIRA